MIRRIDTLSYNNALRQLSPLWKSFFAALMFLLAYTVHPLLQLVITLWMMSWCILHAGIPVRAYGLLFGTALLFYVLSLPALLVEFGHPAAGAPGIFRLPGTGLPVYVTAAGLQRAGLLLARVAACMSCFFFLMLTTPFSELLQVLRRLRMPQIVLELMLIMYRFLFLLSDAAHGMMLSRRLRGGRRGYKARLHETAAMAGALFGNTMHRYYGLSQGLLARGFTDEIILPPYTARPVPRRYAARAYAGITVLLLAQLWLWRLG
ncbi:cobalt ECF transporter T component CbiQ [Paenibacillus sp. MMS20-IR301]|uniref:cobalt ECF transporter T component CbiQ n=1 Tax=Paenibacillus sp. MMS20-IR301 TaxID=2895946 RepID=UPI0028E3AABE|nr:cobalt ECF transporter T component CbiQ [Paenibacillus sp. MMS20-IR301]WNS46558.1 cobalt ECF transporter T component CbiQ [Paenibacillus sp. MMS20-IR301]